MILRGVSFFDTKIKKQLSEILNKIKNILTHWSLAQASSNDEKTGSQKSRWTVPLWYATAARKQSQHLWCESQSRHLIKYSIILKVKTNGGERTSLTLGTKRV